NVIRQRPSSADNFRPSNMGARPSHGRNSSTGRPSTIGIFKNSDGKPVEPKDLASAIFEELDYLGYPFTESFSLKTLLLASTSTFYSIFEFLIKTIGISDPWNPSYLIPANQPKNFHQPISSSQPNAVQQNKNRIELIVYHLTFLKFPTVPKINVFQNMTTPKNWTIMLQILFFLCNDCRFLNLYDAESVLYSMAENQDFIYDYIRKMYNNVVTKGYEYITTEDYKKAKQESLLKYEKLLMGNMNIDKVNNELVNLKKNYEFLNNKRDEFDNLLKEEADLKRQVEKEEIGLGNEKLDYEDRIKRNDILKNECATLREKVNCMEHEVAVKEAQYDRQLASGKQLGNLPIKHSQTVKDLEDLQNLLSEIESEKDELYIVLNQKSLEAKSSINKTNEILNKIKIISKISIEEIPQLELVDLHKKNNMKEYKELFAKVRKDYNESLCKIPNQMSMYLCEKKMIEDKIDTSRITLKNLEQDIKNNENLLAEMKTRTELTVLDFNCSINDKKNDLNEAKKQIEVSTERFMASEENLKKALDEQKIIEAETARNQVEMIENLELLKIKHNEALEQKQREIKNEVLSYKGPIDQLIEQMTQFLPQIQAKNMDF
ncbi:hypothetical protein BpHYR1_053930, partial [Brachionus plicatilis]